MSCYPLGRDPEWEARRAGLTDESEYTPLRNYYEHGGVPDGWQLADDGRTPLTPEQLEERRRRQEEPWDGHDRYTERRSAR